MNWQSELDALANADAWSYQVRQGTSCAEPAAWATLALLAHGEVDAALRSADWLASLQQGCGAVGVSATEAAPRWPTSLAMLAWHSWDQARKQDKFGVQLAAARAWADLDYGHTYPRNPQSGHDTTLAGWSWAANTHSWMEPTCFFVRALSSLGFSEEARVKTGVRMIVDRLLPDGGCNYGNTYVLGQKLLPHVQPSGIAMWALAGHGVSDPRIAKSLDYLQESITSSTSAASLSFALLGLAAHNRHPAEATAWVRRKLELAFEERPISPYHRALLLLSVAPTELNGTGTIETSMPVSGPETVVASNQETAL